MKPPPSAIRDAAHIAALETDLAATRAALGAADDETTPDAAARVVGERERARGWAMVWKAAAIGWKHVQLTWHIPLTAEFERVRRWARAWKAAAHEARRWERITIDECHSLRDLAERDAQAAFAVREEAARLRAVLAAARRYLDYNDNCDYIDGTPDECPGVLRDGVECVWCELRHAVEKAEASE